MIIIEGIRDSGQLIRVDIGELKISLRSSRCTMSEQTLVAYWPVSFDAFSLFDDIIVNAYPRFLFCCFRNFNGL